jgi:hypothetical protein
VQRAAATRCHRAPCVSVRRSRFPGFCSTAWSRAPSIVSSDRLRATSHRLKRGATCVACPGRA